MVLAHESTGIPMVARFSPRQSGYVMAAVSQGQAAEQFTSCSMADLRRFFQEVYAKSPGGMGETVVQDGPRVPSVSCCWVSFYQGC